MGASTMLGITMEESGVSKVISLRLDQDIKLGADIDKEVADFKEEDVPEEEGPLALFRARYLSSPHHDQLRCSRCCSAERSE